MEALFDYFSTIPSLHRSLLLVGGIAFFWIIESLIPLVTFSYHKVKHAGINFFFTITTIIVNFSLAFLLFKSSQWVTTNEFGILYWIGPQPLWIKVLIGVALLDLIAAYFAHYVEHQVKLLWGFHIVHHTDHTVDTTTANRHHPLESVVRFGFTCVAVLIIGAPIGTIMLYQALSVVLSQFNHANIGIPKSVDRWLHWIIVTPNMHKVHHHHSLPYTDSNFGNIFGCWDHLFKTYKQLDAKEIVYGLDTYPDQSSNSKLLPLLTSAFNSYRAPKD